jgi:proteasome lid subunit RPN8/RPN11
MKLQITTNAYQSIVKDIASKTPEQGGILMGKDGIVTDFIYDKEAKTTGSTYSLNVAFLNPLIRELKKQGKQLMGIIHSHPYGCFELSHPDREYFLSQFKNFPDLDFMYTPIVFSAKQDEFAFFPYVFHKDGTVETAELEILPNDYEQYTRKSEEPNAETITQRQEVLIVIKQETQAPAPEKERQQELEPLLLVMLFSNLYFFILGLATAIVPFTFFYIIKNL